VGVGSRISVFFFSLFADKFYYINIIYIFGTKKLGKFETFCFCSPINFLDKFSSFQYNKKLKNIIKKKNLVHNPDSRSFLCFFLARYLPFHQAGHPIRVSKLQSTYICIGTYLVVDYKHLVGT